MNYNFKPKEMLLMGGIFLIMSLVLLVVNVMVHYIVTGNFDISDAPQLTFAADLTIDIFIIGLILFVGGKLYSELQNIKKLLGGV